MASSKRGFAARKVRSSPRRSSRAASPTPTQAAALLTEFRGTHIMRRLDAPGRARLDTLMPRLLAAIADVRMAESPQVDVLRRILRVLEAIGTRSAYFALLNENQSGAAQTGGARGAR